MNYRFLYITFIGVISALPLPSHAQTNSEMADRIDRLQRDIMTLQRQVARGDSGSTAATDDSTPPPGTPVSASLEVRISALEDQMRSLRGQIEENQHQIKALSDNFDKYHKDTDYRLNEISQAQATTTQVSQTTQPVSSSPPPTADTKDIASKDAAKTDKAVKDDKKEPAKEDKKPTSADAKPEAAAETYDNPKDLYQHGFRLLNQNRYDEADSSFQDFIKKYPKDPLIGNVYYWLGETYYIRKDYTHAADNFRQGFEALPSGPKASDNLLKLGMSLSAMDQKKEACIVLKQIGVKFKDSGKPAVKRAEAESTRIGCGS